MCHLLRCRRMWGRFRLPQEHHTRGSVRRADVPAAGSGGVIQLWQRLVALPRRVGLLSPSPPQPAPAPPQAGSPPSAITDEDHRKLKVLLSLLNEDSQPNINALNET